MSVIYFKLDGDCFARIELQESRVQVVRLEIASLAFEVNLAALFDQPRRGSLSLQGLAARVMRETLQFPCRQTMRSSTHA